MSLSNQVSTLKSSYEGGTSDLQCPRDAPTHPNKNILDVVRQCLSGRDVILWPPCLHEGSKATVINNLKRSVIFCDPAHEFCTADDISDICQTSIYAKRTVLQS
jgi:hypothetical protein